MIEGDELYRFEMPEIQGVCQIYYTARGEVAFPLYLAGDVADLDLAPLTREEARLFVREGRRMDAINADRWDVNMPGIIPDDVDDFDGPMGN